MGWWSGSKDKVKQYSNLTPEQQQAHGQLGLAASGRGAGGAFGSAADYYRDLLSDDSSTFNAMAAPQLRQYNEDIIPGISEQFAGMGSGGLSSSGFRNAQIQGATDLSERLGAIRANLRQAGAQGLQGIGQQYLNPVSENVLHQGQPGAAQGIFQGVGAAIPAGVGGYAKSFGNTNPYGQGGPQASPQGRS